MTEHFELFQGDRLPDFSSPLLIVVVVEMEKFSRTERFLITPQDVERSASTYKWRDLSGLEIRVRHDASRLENLELARAKRDIQTRIRATERPDTIALYRDFDFHRIPDAKSFLATEQLLGQLPSLSKINGSRCHTLRELIAEISRIKPIVADTAPEDWYEP
jgi:hypothetical protein